MHAPSQGPYGHYVTKKKVIWPEKSLMENGAVPSEKPNNAKKEDSAGKSGICGGPNERS